MKITKSKTKLNKLIVCRVSEDHKKKYQENAKMMGISLTEMIMALLDGAVAPDRANQNKLYEFLHKLTKEMNLIGKNINQATLALHQIKNSEKMEVGEFQAFNNLLMEYIAKREELKDTIENLIKNV